MRENGRAERLSSLTGCPRTEAVMGCGPYGCLLLFLGAARRPGREPLKQADEAPGCSPVVANGTSYLSGCSSSALPAILLSPLRRR
jgi:hypothetical protein